MCNVEVVSAALEYIDQIMVIENLSFSIPWSRESFLDEISSNRFAHYICAQIDGRIVGYAGMWKVCDEGHITNIAVHPDYRGRGIGEKLLAALIEQAGNGGIRSLTLEVRKNNLVAQRLYIKFGFSVQGIRKAYYSDNNEDALIMWKHGL